jgi:hypothetical protein
MAPAMASNSRARSPISSCDVTPVRRAYSPPATSRARAQDPQRAQRAQREQERRRRDREPGDAEAERHLQRRLLVVGEPLGDLSALAAQRPAQPVQAVRERREVALELGPRLGRRAALGRARLRGEGVDLLPQRRDLLARRLELRAPRRRRLLLEEAVDGGDGVVEVLARALEREREVRIEPHVAAERGREVVEGLPRRVDGALEIEVRLVGEHALTRLVDREHGERRVTREGDEEHREREQDFPRNPQAHAGLR